MKTLKEFLIEARDETPIKVEFYEGSSVVEVSTFDSIDDLLNDKVDDIGTKLSDIFTPKQITMLKNGRKVRYSTPYSNNSAVKITG